MVLKKKNRYQRYLPASASLLMASTWRTRLCRTNSLKRSGSLASIWKDKRSVWRTCPTRDWKCILKPRRTLRILVELGNSHRQKEHDKKFDQNLVPPKALHFFPIHIEKIVKSSIIFSTASSCSSIRMQKREPYPMVDQFFPNVNDVAVETNASCLKRNHHFFSSSYILKARGGRYFIKPQIGVLPLGFA